MTFQALPIVTDGAALDTSAACPPPRIVEQDKLRELKAKEAHRLAPDRAKAHKRFVLEQAERIVAKTGMAPDAARRTVERQCAGVLLPAVVLPFDGEDMRGRTVADVLADPDRFVGATLADPLEGIEYGRCGRGQPAGTIAWQYRIAGQGERPWRVYAPPHMTADTVQAFAVSILGRLASFERTQPKGAFSFQSEAPSTGNSRDFGADDQPEPWACWCG